MIFESEHNFVLVNNSFKKPSKLLYDDYVTNDLEYGSVAEFLINSSKYLIRTSFKDYYFNSKDSVKVMDFLTNNIFDYLPKDIHQYDYLILPKRKFEYQSLSFDFSKYLVNRKFDFSQNVSVNDIDFKIDLKDLKDFILFSSPTVESKYIEKFNNNFNENHKKSCNRILKNFSLEIPKKNLKMNEQLLELLYISVCQKFTIKSEAEVILNLESDSSLKIITSFLTELGIKFTTKDCNIIVYSNFITKLLKDDFNSFSIVLDLSKKYSLLLVEKLKKLNYLVFHSLISAFYIQEFLYRHDTLSSLSRSEYYCLSIDKTIKQDAFYFYPQIQKIEVNTNPNLIEIGL